MDHCNVQFNRGNEPDDHSTQEGRCYLGEYIYAAQFRQLKVESKLKKEGIDVTLPSVIDLAELKDLRHGISAGRKSEQSNTKVSSRLICVSLDDKEVETGNGVEEEVAIGMEPDEYEKIDWENIETRMTIMGVKLQRRVC